MPQTIAKKKHLVSDILHKYFDSYLNHSDRKLYLEDKHFKAVNSIKTCRSKTLGYAVLHCDDCNINRYIYRSCDHRFCAQCGVEKTNKWAKETLSRLVNIAHHHVVFTLPVELRAMAKANEALIYKLLFQSSAQVLKEFFNQKHNSLPGVVSVLHTAGSDLKYHPHLHILLSAGGLDLDDNTTIKPLKNNYLCPQRFLANKMRKIFTTGLSKYFNKGALSTNMNKKQFVRFVNKLKNQQWIVSVQEPIENVEQIVRYVGRYTKRACISEYRIQAIDNDVIEFEYKDYKNSDRKGKPVITSICLPYVAFLDKLLQHVPEKGFRMVRYFGLYNSQHKNKIPSDFLFNEDECKTEQSESTKPFEQHQRLTIALQNYDPLQCPSCLQQLELKGHEYLDFCVLINSPDYDSS